MTDSHIRARWDADVRHALLPAVLVSGLIFLAGCVGFLT